MSQPDDVRDMMLFPETPKQMHDMLVLERLAGEDDSECAGDYFSSNSAVTNE